MPSQTAEILEIEIPAQLVNLKRGLSSPSFLAGAESDLNRVLTIAEIFDTAVGAAEGDAGLSPKGKSDASAKAARIAFAALDAFTSTTIGGLDARSAGVAAAAMKEKPEPTDVGDRIVAAIRAAEIRKMFREYDDLERTSAYRSTDDDETRDALENSPPILVRVRPGDMPTLQPMIDPVCVQEQALGRAEAKDPAAAALLRDLALLARTYRTVVASARTSIAEVAPTVVPPGDYPLAVDPTEARARLMR
jgi:hypothetical protein